MSFTNKRIYKTFFLGRNFVYSVHWTLKQKNLKKLSTFKNLKNLKPKNFF